MAGFSANVFPVLLAGGSGTRLWPVSRELYPKQLVKFFGDDSLVQATVRRLLPVLDANRVRVVCGQQHYHEIARHLEEIGISSVGKIFAEPTGRNTAPAILLAAFQIEAIDPDAIICIFPADHVIADTACFHEDLAAAVRLAAAGYIVTFGITPGYPESGYGYVEGSEALTEGGLKLKRFVEKPDKETARSYIDAGNFFWNSGMFAFKVAVILEEFRRYQPDMLDQMAAVFSPDKQIAAEDYNRLDNISIDYAIMEKTDRGAVLPSNFGWSDIGSWKALYDFLPKDADQNVIDGDVITQNTTNCFISGYERLIATNCIRDLVVVETPDSIFISDIDHSRDVKSIVQELKQKNRRETRLHRKAHYAWGTLTLLEKKPGYRITRIDIYPGAMWQPAGITGAAQQLIVLSGRAELMSGTNTTDLTAAEAYSFSGDGRSRIVNAAEEPLQLLHIQMGGEDPD